MWLAVLLPLEREPRDSDQLIPSMLALVEKTEGAGPVHSALLVYANVGMLTPERSRECADLIARQTSRAIDDLGRRLGEPGPEVRWEDDYVTVKTDARLLLDLLGRRVTDTAPDVEVLAWAKEHHFVVITNDLDFSAILAASAGATPSVVQIRTQDVLSDAAVSIVARALEAHREDIDRGALLSIDEGGTRVRMLPLEGSQDPS